jgi:hypothetical protein
VRVGVDDGDESVGGALEPEVEPPGLAAVDRILENGYARVSGRGSRRDASRFVGRSVVEHEDLERRGS